MSKRLLCVIVACGVFGLFAGSALSWRDGKDGGDGGFEMYVSPGTIATSAACTWVTVHTDEPFQGVDGVLAEVDSTEVDVAQTFDDDRGNLVAKLRFQDVVACIPPSATSVTLTLTVIRVTGETLVASQTVPVKK